jgi:ketosteroid isomerase-like protein
MSYPTSVENDLRAIRALNQRDIEAVLASDTDAIMSQWSDEFVVLPPAGPIVRGRAANAEIVKKGVEQLRAVQPLEFVADFEEIKVLGDYALEWGTYRGTSRPRAGGDAVSYSGKLMHILQRQPDGSWKIE